MKTSCLTRCAPAAQPITFTAGASAAKPAPKPEAEPDKGLGSAAAPAADRSGSGKTPIPIPEAAAAAKAVAERLKARAERFGVASAAPDADKKEQRAERWPPCLPWGTNLLYSQHRCMLWHAGPCMSLLRAAAVGG